MNACIMIRTHNEAMECINCARELLLTLFPGFGNLYNPYVQVVKMYCRCLLQKIHRKTI